MINTLLSKINELFKLINVLCFMNNEIIKVKSLTKKFQNFEALKDVSFNVYKNDVFGFLGPNGAGKSTTLRCMLSLIKKDSGEIKLFGKKLENNRAEILSKIGSIIEKPDFYKYLSAQKNLELLARVSGKKVNKSEIEDILNFVGLKNRSKSKFKTFSHGMKQRLGIAQALMHDPELVILDEPTTGLDPEGIIEIRNLILKLKKEQGKTIILSSHQLSEIEMIANRMVIISRGKTVIEGDVNDLLNSDEILVRFQVNEPKSVFDKINTSFSNIYESKISSNGIEMITNIENIPEITSFLIKNNSKIYSIEQKRKLEDYFIKTINSENNVN